MLQTYLNIVYNILYFSDCFSISWSRGRSWNIIIVSWVKYYLRKINMFIITSKALMWKNNSSKTCNIFIFSVSQKPQYTCILKMRSQFAWWLRDLVVRNIDWGIIYFKIASQVWLEKYQQQTAQAVLIIPDLGVFCRNIYNNIA